MPGTEVRWQHRSPACVRPTNQLSQSIDTRQLGMLPWTFGARYDADSSRRHFRNLNRNTSLPSLSLAPYRTL